MEQGMSTSTLCTLSPTIFNQHSSHLEPTRFQCSNWKHPDGISFMLETGRDATCPEWEMWALWNRSRQQCGLLNIGGKHRSVVIRVENWQLVQYCADSPERSTRLIWIQLAVIQHTDSSLLVAKECFWWYSRDYIICICSMAPTHSNFLIGEAGTTKLLYSVATSLVQVMKQSGTIPSHQWQEIKSIFCLKLYTHHNYNSLILNSSVNDSTM